MFSLPIDALYLSSPSELFYFSGYSNADARLLLTSKELYYISDARVKEEVSTLLPQFEFIEAEGGDYVGAAIKIINACGYERVGFEANKITYAEFLRLERANTEWVDAENMLRAAHAVKTEEEISAIRAAQEITDSVFADILDNAREGISEEMLAAIVNSRIYASGGELAFETIVAFGENTSKPHAHPSKRPLRKGDCVTVDFGAKRFGYCSDMTRSFCFGDPGDDYKNIYSHVLEAQKLALVGICAGMKGYECDAIARDYFKKCGYSEHFTHSLGHSLGIDIHESPNFSPRCKEEIPDGAVLSVEPGLYFPGKFGVRIEDIVIVKNSGIENLTKSEKTLIIL